MIINLILTSPLGYMAPMPWQFCIGLTDWTTSRANLELSLPSKISTPLKFNIDPEKWWLEDYFPIGKVTFQGLSLLNFGGVRQMKVFSLGSPVT